MYLVVDNVSVAEVDVKEAGLLLRAFIESLEMGRVVWPELIQSQPFMSPAIFARFSGLSCLGVVGQAFNRRKESFRYAAKSTQKKKKHILDITNY